MEECPNYLKNKIELVGMDQRLQRLQDKKVIYI